jgi:hypothetical protein
LAATGRKRMFDLAGNSFAGEPMLPTFPKRKQLPNL